MVKLYITLISFITFIVIVSWQPANAQETSSCQQIYGGGESCIQKGKLILNITIQHPTSSDLIDILPADNATFKPGQAVIFHITVTNTDNKIINNISVSDPIPQYLTFSSGQGDYNSTANTFNYTISKLNPGESQTRILHMKVEGENKLPDRSVSCTINQAKASSGSEYVSMDNAQLCIESRVLGAQTGNQSTGSPSLMPPVAPAQNVNQTPATGAESLALIALVPAGLAGLLIRRLTHKKANSS